MNMLGENEISLTLIRDPKSRNWTKYIDVIHQYIFGLVEDRKLPINWIESFAILADSLIKAFSTALVKKDQEEWGLIEYKKCLKVWVVEQENKKLWRSKHAIKFEREANYVIVNDYVMQFIL